MKITSEHLAGLAVGLGVGAAGFYLYKKNQPKVDAWLKGQGLNLPNCGDDASASSSLEDLVRQKEHIEDLIAEREMDSGADEAAEA